jgi:hypothetical protein
MEELLKVVELVRQEAPQARVKVDSLMVTHYFTMEELLSICNKYADFKCALQDVLGQSEQLKAFAEKVNNYYNGGCGTAEELIDKMNSL